MPILPTVNLITYNNTANRFPLEVQAERLGIKLHVVAQDFQPWSWVAKITEPKSLLENAFSPEQLVLLADGNDTIFTRPPYIEEILSALKRYRNPEVLFCPTCDNWPPNKECREFERDLSSSSKPYLSAGAYVGTAKGILQGMAWIEERRNKGWLRFGGKFDDQLGWRRAHRALYPKFAIDTDGLVFNRFDNIFLRSMPKNIPWMRRKRTN
jgi:hypothetical protein